jgi:hypothetical protein
LNLCPSNVDKDQAIDAITAVFTVDSGEDVPPIEKAPAAFARPGNGGRTQPTPKYFPPLRGPGLSGPSFVFEKATSAPSAVPNRVASAPRDEPKQFRFPRAENLFCGVVIFGGTGFIPSHELLETTWGERVGDSACGDGLRRNAGGA